MDKTQQVIGVLKTTRHAKVCDHSMVIVNDDLVAEAFGEPHAWKCVECGFYFSASGYAHACPQSEEANTANPQPK